MIHSMSQVQQTASDAYRHAARSTVPVQAHTSAPICTNVLLDVHHGVGVLAGVGLAATAGAGSNGHAMLPAGQVAPHWDVQGGVGVEEAEGLEKEAHVLSRHDGPVLDAWDVGHPKGVPDDAVSLNQIPVLH